MSSDLPQNIRLETLKLMPNGEVLLRLAHLFAKSEDSTLSLNVSVDLSQLFVNTKLLQATEMTLTANRYFFFGYLFF